MEQADPPETSIEFDRLCLLTELVERSKTLPLRLPASAEQKVELSVNIPNFSLKIAVTLFFVTSLVVSHEPISPLSSKRGFCKVLIIIC